MTDPTDHLAVPPPPDPARVERLVRRAHARLAGEEPRAHPLEAGLVALFAVATLAWALVSVGPIA